MISPTVTLTLSWWKHSRSVRHNVKPIKPPVAAPLENFSTCPGSHLCPYLCQKALLSLAPVLIQVSAPPKKKQSNSWTFTKEKKRFTLFELSDAFLRTSYISFHTGLRFSLITLLLNVNSPTLILAYGSLFPFTMPPIMLSLAIRLWASNRMILNSPCEQREVHTSIR